MQNRLQALRLDQNSILQNRRLEFRPDVLFLGLCASENNAALGQHADCLLGDVQPLSFNSNFVYQ